MSKVVMLVTSDTINVYNAPEVQKDADKLIKRLEKPLIERRNKALKAIEEARKAKKKQRAKDEKEYYELKTEVDKLWEDLEGHSQFFIDLFMKNKYKLWHTLNAELLNKNLSRPNIVRYMIDPKCYLGEYYRGEYVGKFFIPKKEIKKFVDKHGFYYVRKENQTEIYHQ